MCAHVWVVCTYVTRKTLSPPLCAAAAAAPRVPHCHSAAAVGSRDGWMTQIPQLSDPESGTLECSLAAGGELASHRAGQQRTHTHDPAA